MNQPQNGFFSNQFFHLFSVTTFSTATILSSTTARRNYLPCSVLIGLSSSHLWTRRAYWFGRVGTLTSSGVSAQITFQWRLISAFNLLAFEQMADFFINGHSALATSMVGVPCHHVKANGTESWVQAWIGHSPRKKTRWIHNGIEFVPGEESAESIVRSCASTSTNNTGACLCPKLTKLQSWTPPFWLVQVCTYPNIRHLMIVLHIDLVDRSRIAGKTGHQ